MTPEDNCYFHTSISKLKEMSNSYITYILNEGTKILYDGQNTDPSQIRAWENELDSLNDFLYKLPDTWEVIFEYVLPREFRRTDVILLNGSEVFVLEFKQYNEEHLSHLDQIKGYVRDLESYQEYCANHKVIPMLVLTGSFTPIKNYYKTVEQIPIISPDNLQTIITPYIKNTKKFDPLDFLNADYKPLPTIVSAVSTIFNKEPFPEIKTAKSSKIKETIEFLQEKTDNTISEHKNLLILVTGVPGAGKSLIGMQYAVNNNKDGNQKAVLLSGNLYLVKVLNYILNGNSFIQLIKNFVNYYAQPSEQIPNEAIIIYDEAQRAWDAQKSGGGTSEPHKLLNIAKKKNGIVVVCLVGEGQEIYKGEEAGLKQWNDAVLSTHLKWDIYCPKHIANIFPNAIISEELNLDKSLRSRSALNLPKWANAVLMGDVNSAKSFLTENCTIDGFKIEITRKLLNIDSYFKERYKKEPLKTYGYVTSSKGSKNLFPYPQVSNDDIGPWYADPISSPKSCRNLNTCVTEFQCQGLELDLPVVCWKNDYVYSNKDKKWHTLIYEDEYSIKSGIKNPKQLRLNSYRVLLTRGRDGLFIYIPLHPDLDDTYSFITNCLKKD